MSDQFFEDEEELARADAAAARSAVPKRASRPASTSKTAAGAAPSAGAAAVKPPSFALVVAIAAVALLLGVCIGYFFAMSIVGSSQDAGQGSAVSSTTVTSGDASEGSATTDAASMPEGHPDIASMINPDGTVNEEALAQYKAQRAAEQEQGSGAGEDADSVDSSSGN